jgi:class 3 adenylate cyclase
VLQTADDAAAPANGERRTATALFADIRVSTELEQGLESEETREMIAEIYGWFTEGFGTADLKDAKALLGELGI